MIRILIFLFTMMIGMMVGLNTTHAQTKQTAVPAGKQTSPTPTPAKAPVPMVTGTVVDVSATSLTIRDDAGQSTTLTFSATVRVEAPAISSIKGKPTMKDIAVNDVVAAVTQDQTTTPLVVIGAKNGKVPAMHKVFMGIVSSREATSSGTILSLKSPAGDQFAKSLVNTATKISARNIDKPTVDDIKAGDDVVVSGPANNQDLITAWRLFLIPGKARGLLDQYMKSTMPQTQSTKSATAAGTLKPASSSALSH